MSCDGRWHVRVRTLRSSLAPVTVRCSDARPHSASEIPVSSAQPPAHTRSGRMSVRRSTRRTYTPKSKARNRIPGTNCDEMAVSCIRFRGVSPSLALACLEINHDA
eukprot:2546318-Rhodomonas_salina.3